MIENKKILKNSHFISVQVYLIGCVDHKQHFNNTYEYVTKKKVTTVFLCARGHQPEPLHLKGVKIEWKQFVII